MRSVIRSPQTLGTALRQARQAAGLTQKDLGSRTNLRQATISSLETGEGGTLETLFALVTFLKLEFYLTERSHAQSSLEDIF